MPWLMWEPRVFKIGTPPPPPDPTPSGGYAGGGGIGSSYDPRSWSKLPIPAKNKKKKEKKKDVAEILAKKVDNYKTKRRAQIKEGFEPKVEAKEFVPKPSPPEIRPLTKEQLGELVQALTPQEISAPVKAEPTASPVVEAMSLAEAREKLNLDEEEDYLLQLLLEDDDDDED